MLEEERCTCKRIAFKTFDVQGKKCINVTNLVRQLLHPALQLIVDVSIVVHNQLVKLEETPALRLPGLGG